MKAKKLNFFHTIFGNLLGMYKRKNISVFNQIVLQNISSLKTTGTRQLYLNFEQYSSDPETGEYYLKLDLMGVSLFA